MYAELIGNYKSIGIKSSMGNKMMAELADEELSGTVPKQVENKEEVWDDIGFYTDEYGHKKWGRIPKT
jgi:hypothetical protein